MSPGLIACPDGMFSVAGTMLSRLTGNPSRAIAAVASITAAPPDMSIFISCILPEGLIEIPPVSKVTALPTSASPGAAAVVAQHDEARLLVRALRHRLQAAHVAAGDLVGAEGLSLEAVDLGRRGRARARRASPGVRSLEGRFCRSRAAFWCSTTSRCRRPRSTGPPARTRPRAAADRRPRRRSFELTCSGRTGTRASSVPSASALAMAASSTPPGPPTRDAWRPRREPGRAQWRRRHARARE